jgi:predicted transcriptional regulator
VVQALCFAHMAHKPKSEQTTRMSVTLLSETHASLETIAKQKKVSLAWVMRDAAEKYVAEQWPLFAHDRNS